MKRWTTVDGLPQNSISALLQTRDGYLWIGTATAGLVRFDGIAFKAFTLLDTPGLPSDRISALYEGADGTLWIGTSAGLARYRDGAFTSERLGDDVSHNAVSDIASDRDGRLWVAAHGRVVRRDDDQWTVIPTSDGGGRRLFPSPDGTMWIATASKGLIEWRGQMVRTLTMREGLPSDSVLAVREDRSGRVWIGTDRGLASLDRGTGQVVAERERLSGAPIYALFEDSRGVLWIGATGRLVARDSGGALVESPLEDHVDVEPGRVTVLTEDREGHVWFGVEEGKGGLHRLARERVSTVAYEAGLPCDNVGAVTQGADDTIWIATLCRNGKGLVAIRDGHVTAHAGPAYIESLLAEPDGTVWAGTFGGDLWRSEHGAFVTVASPAGEGRDGIAVLYRHDDGALWLGTNRGLVRWRDGQWTRLRAADGLISDDVRAIVGAGGALWIGTDLGVSHYADGRFTNYGVSDGVPPGPVRAIHVDADGVVWIGTYGGGLARYEDGAVTAFGVRGGALGRSVHRILEDDDGFLWLTGDRGIRRVSKRDLRAIADGHAASLDVTLYDEADGMRSAECNGMAQPAGWRTRDGAFQVPTQRGLVRIDPARMTPGAAPAPAPHIEDAVVDGRPVRRSLGEGGSSAAASVVVPAGHRDVEIRYTAPAHARPEQVQFRYRLDGYDGDWIDVGTRRVAAFVNLRPGRYRFLVTARHGGGAWSEPPAAVTLVLQPYFYQRPWFQIAVALLAIVAASAVGRWHIGNLRRRAQRLERAVADRTADLSVAHARLSAAHEGLATAKHEVEQAHGQVLAVFNQLDVGVLVLSVEGVVRHASASAQRFLGKDAEALVGRSWSTCLPLVDADRAQVKARVEAISQSYGRLPAQMVIAGKRFWMEIDVRAEPPPGDGRILYMYNATEVSALQEEGHAGGGHRLVGRSTAMHLLQKQIRDVGRVDTTVLIEGETGVGKELVARAIHRCSRRADQPFVAINAAGLSESLLASQLFGHRRGAFTGAVDEQIGVFEAANGGTLFLDEVGDMPPSVQASLLRVLQEREITRVGESHPRRVDVRFLAATHRDLTREVEAGHFREDLRYRIQVATIVVPPLRARLDDVPLLVDTFLAEAAHEAGRPTPQMSRDAIDALLRHTWPGNVRELRAVIERSLVDAHDDIVRIEDLPREIAAGREPARRPEPLVTGGTERDRLVEALRRSGGNRTEAARLLGFSRRTMYRRLAEHGLDD